MPVGRSPATGNLDPSAGRREFKVRELQHRLGGDENRPGLLERVKTLLIRPICLCIPRLLCSLNLVSKAIRRFGAATGGQPNGEMDVQQEWTILFFHDL